MKAKRKKQISQQPPSNEDVVEETSLELVISKLLVREVVSAQSEFTAERIREGGFEGVMWPLFGKIRVKVTKVHQIHDLVGNQNIKKNTVII
jgi:hypothetical protein